MRKQRYEDNATRSADVPERFDLITPEGDRALARRFALGAVRHGDNNWMGGGSEFIKTTINHLRAHLTSLLAGDKSDEHTAAVVWGAHALCWFRERKPKEFARAIRELRGLK